MNKSSDFFFNLTNVHRILHVNARIVGLDFHQNLKIRLLDNKNLENYKYQ